MTSSIFGSLKHIAGRAKDLLVTTSSTVLQTARLPTAILISKIISKNRQTPLAILPPLENNDLNPPVAPAKEVSVIGNIFGGATNLLSNTANAVHAFISEKIPKTSVRVPAAIWSPEGIDLNPNVPPVKKASINLVSLKDKLDTIVPTQLFSWIQKTEPPQIKASEEAKKKTDEQCQKFIEDFSTFTLLDTMLNWSGWNPSENRSTKILEMIRIKRSAESGTIWELFRKQMDQELSFFQMAKAGIVYFCLEYCTGMVSGSLKACIESFKEQTRSARATTTLPLDTLLAEFIKEFDPFLENHQNAYEIFATSTKKTFKPIDECMQENAVKKTWNDERKVYREWSEAFVRVYLPKIPIFHKWFDLPFPMNHLMRLCAMILEPIVTWFAKILLSRFILPSTLETIAHSTIAEKPLGFLASMVRTCLTQVAGLLRLMEKEAGSKGPLPTPSNIVGQRAKLKGMLQKLLVSITYQTALTDTGGLIKDRHKIIDSTVWWKSPWYKLMRKPYIQDQLAGVLSEKIFDAAQYFNDPANTEDILHTIFTSARSMYTLQDPNNPVLTKKSYIQTSDHLVEHVEELIKRATNDNITQLFHGTAHIRKEATLNEYLEEIKKASQALNAGVRCILEKNKIADDQPIAILKDIVAIRDQFYHAWISIQDASSPKEVGLGKVDKERFARTIQPLYNLYDSCVDTLTRLSQLQKEVSGAIALRDRSIKTATEGVEKIKTTISILEKLLACIPEWSELLEDANSMWAFFNRPLFRQKIAALCVGITSSEGIFNIFSSFSKDASPAAEIQKLIAKENLHLLISEKLLQKQEQLRLQEIKEYKGLILEQFAILQKDIDTLENWHKTVRLEKEVCLNGKKLLSTALTASTALFTSSLGWIGWAVTGAATALGVRKFVFSEWQETAGKTLLVSVAALTCPIAPLIKAAAVPYVAEPALKAVFSSVLKKELQTTEDGVSELWSLSYFPLSCFLALLGASKTTIEKHHAPI